MNPAVVAVLVVPAEGDPGGLLAPGRCGAVPPSAVEVQDARRSASARWELDRPLGTSLWARALPLLWDGALVPEGWDRFVRVVDPDDYDRMPRWPELSELLAIVEHVRRTTAAAGIVDPYRVVRLARVDGRLVEVP